MFCRCFFLIDIADATIFDAAAMRCAAIDERADARATPLTLLLHTLYAAEMLSLLLRCFCLSCRLRAPATAMLLMMMPRARIPARFAKMLFRQLRRRRFRARRWRVAGILY